MMLTKINVKTYEPQISGILKHVPVRRDHFVNPNSFREIKSSKYKEYIYNIYIYIFVSGFRPSSERWILTEGEKNDICFKHVATKTWIKVATGAGGRISVNGKFVPDIWPYHGA